MESALALALLLALAGDVGGSDDDDDVMREQRSRREHERLAGREPARSARRERER
jgi:hypothetical protein